jgi:hypothetical protein
MAFISAELSQLDRKKQSAMKFLHSHGLYALRMALEAGAHNRHNDAYVGRWDTGDDRRPSAKGLCCTNELPRMREIVSC